jgi:hypothetical protein
VGPALDDFGVIDDADTIWGFGRARRNWFRACADVDDDAGLPKDVKAYPNHPPHPPAFAIAGAAPSINRMSRAKLTRFGFANTDPAKIVETAFPGNLRPMRRLIGNNGSLYVVEPHEAWLEAWRRTTRYEWRDGLWWLTPGRFWPGVWRFVPQKRKALCFWWQAMLIFPIEDFEEEYEQEYGQKLALDAPAFRFVDHPPKRRLSK